MPQFHLPATDPAANFGELIHHSSFYSHTLGNERDLVVYLPPGYQREAGRGYPVLYMQDGQNLFDGRTSFVPGQHWHLSETADNLIRENAIEPPIIVGIHHAGQQRVEEYTPTHDPNFKVGGGADLYGRMIVEELKPFIDGAYHTLPGREHTGLGGSSLGGLVSLYLGFKQSDTFGRVIAMSPSLWWDRRWLLRHLGQLDQVATLRLWLDAGTREGGGTRRNAKALSDALVARGFKAGFTFMEAEGASHCEQDWAHRVHHALRFVYPAQPVETEQQSSDRAPHHHSRVTSRLRLASGHETFGR
ncbi:MAG: alpha/beta hydrolase [Pyrinomonadaceae bacterium]